MCFDKTGALIPTTFSTTCPSCTSICGSCESRRTHDGFEDGYYHLVEEEHGLAFPSVLCKAIDLVDVHLRQ